ncbi:LytR/AlgR family response regulator transcription factor [Chryseobacterium oryctis]|uniref:LytTR family DNA-binding domain-containing protein n=1 Tax=Chryseobacterium oryctis TaxID=2952618 RepID=A0ABT3HN09_9FLAO|nr:LytTR family DNA-binding domain-containing protein [Chryseobacterium oryctis]MCW3161108.1 LytTR family DNA-binding domain-containing protein [Chryseobacterium oryctis]
MKTKLQICIIDEHDDIENLTKLLKREFPEFKVAFYTNNIEDAYIYLSKNSPHLLFLNMKFIDENGIKIFRKIRRNLSQIIFIAESEREAIEAIKKGVTDYLLKPIKNLDFVILINKALEAINYQKTFTYSNSLQNKINIPTIQGFKRINIDEIIRCEADSNYTFIHLLDKTKVLVCKTLQEFENYFSEHNFFRVHHKHLINLDHLREYIKGKGGQVIMTDNSVVDVSVRKKNDFLYKMDSSN